MCRKRKRKKRIDFLVSLVHNSLNSEHEALDAAAHRPAPGERMGQCCCTIRWTNKRTLQQVSHTAPAIKPSRAPQAAPTDRLRSLAGCDRCADCGRLGPDWAVKNHGVLVCIRCAGVHRALGVHISVVQHLTADDWERAAIDAMAALRGNRAVNRALEERLPADLSRAALIGDDRLLEQFIRSKYAAGAFRRGGDGRLVSASAAARPTSQSKVAMVEYVGLVFITLRQGRALPAGESCLPSPPYVVFSTSGQSVTSAPGRPRPEPLAYDWTPAPGQRTGPSKVSLNVRSVRSVIAVQLCARDLLGYPHVLAVGELTLPKQGGGADAAAQQGRPLSVKLTAVRGDGAFQAAKAGEPGPTLELLVDVHIIT